MGIAPYLIILLHQNSVTHSFIHPSFCIAMSREARVDILKAEPGPVSVSLRVYLQDRVQEMEFTILKILNIQEPWARSFCLTCKLICAKMRLLNSNNFRINSNNIKCKWPNYVSGKPGSLSMNRRPGLTSPKQDSQHHKVSWLFLNHSWLRKSNIFLSWFLRKPF